MFLPRFDNRLALLVLKCDTKGPPVQHFLWFNFAAEYVALLMINKVHWCTLKIVICKCQASSYVILVESCEGRIKASAKKCTNVP
jgi:hypothetical protein